LNFDDVRPIVLGIEAAGRVLLTMMKQVNATTRDELLRMAGLVPSRLCR